MMKITLFIALVLVVCSCSNIEHKTDAENLFTINFEEILDKEQQVSLSDIASDVEYVVLETNDDCMIRPVVDYYITDSYIFVRNFDHILKYTRDGKFLMKIGSPGRGPGEIDLIRIMSVLPEQRLIIVQLNSQRKLLYFDFDGNHVRTVDLPAPYFHIAILNDERFLIHYHIYAGNEQYTFSLANENWDTLSAVQNYANWTHSSSVYLSISYPEFKSFYCARKDWYLKSMYNDTVYTIDSDIIEPAYFINLGKYKLPEELRPERLGVEQIQRFRNNQEYYYFPIVLEADNIIFFRACSYGESSNRYITFDRSSREGINLVDADGESTGFVNDWDGGIDFWPVGNINDNQVYMPVTVMDFQKAIEEGKNNNIHVKFTGNQEQLFNMISGKDVTSNPILMIVTLKENR